MKTYQIEESSNIKSVSYNPDTKELIIAFLDGAEYQYTEVRPEEVVKLMFSESAGKAFHRNIKQHDYKKIKDKS